MLAFFINKICVSRGKNSTSLKTDESNLKLSLFVVRFLSKLIVARQTTLAINMFENWQYDLN